MLHRSLLVAAATAVLLSGCAASTAPAERAAAAPAAAADVTSAESRRLAELVEQYFEDYLKLNPLAATSIGDPRYDDRFEVAISPEWRARAERELGPGFDIRRFHDAVLSDGALPLDVIEAKLDRWIAAEKGG